MCFARPRRTAFNGLKQGGLWRLMHVTPVEREEELLSHQSAFLRRHTIKAQISRNESLGSSNPLMFTVPRYVDYCTTHQFGLEDTGFTALQKHNWRGPADRIEFLANPKPTPVLRPQMADFSYSEDAELQALNTQVVSEAQYFLERHLLMETTARGSRRLRGLGAARPRCRDTRGREHLEPKLESTSHRGDARRLRSVPRTLSAVLR